jgi:CRP-like cAMP-binding protein
MNRLGASGVSRRVYLLPSKGRVAVRTAKPHARPLALHSIEPDQHFGELCLCSVRTDARGTTAYAVVESEAIEIKLNNFLAHLHHNRAALDALVVMLSLRLRDAHYRIGMMVHRGAQQRLGSLLLRLATSRGPRSRVGRRETATVS